MLQRPLSDVSVRFLRSVIARSSSAERIELKMFQPIESKGAERLSHSPLLIHTTRRGTAFLGTLAIGSAMLIATPLAAGAEPSDLGDAKGRAVGSGKWGYVRQFGELNKNDKPEAGQFMLPYGIDVQGNLVAVADSGFASWEDGTKVAGHAVHTFELTAAPGSSGHGDYLGGGQYDIVDNKSGVFDPADIIEAKAVAYFDPTEPRGPRGVAFDPLDDAVISSSFESPEQELNVMRRYTDATLGTPSRVWGPSIGNMREPGSLHLATAVDTDSSGNIYVGTQTGVSVFNQEGELLTTISWYFDHNAEDQRAPITWPNRNTSVPEHYVKPGFLGETYGLSVMEEEGKIIVFVGDSGEHYQPDPAVHFPDGSTTATGLKPASIKKFILTPSGGIVDDEGRFNPKGWSWELDETFGTGGAVQFDNPSFSIDGRFSKETVFALEADPASGTLYFALQGNPDGTQIGALELSTGSLLTPITRLNSPSAQQDSQMNYVRGIAVDDRGLVYATTQDSTFDITERAIVQIWGKTPTSISGFATADPDRTSVELSWAESSVGYQQPDLLDYVVQYREVGATDWTIAPIQGGAGTSTEPAREITGLTPGTEYEARITPYNEAGSGDPAEVTWRTETAQPAISVVKEVDGVEAADEADAVSVPADSGVVFTFTVTNTGDVPVTDVTVSDDLLGEITSVLEPSTGFDGSLASGESVTFQAEGTIAAGPHVNTVTVRALTEFGESLVATTSWHGFGDLAVDPVDPIDPVDPVDPEDPMEPLPGDDLAETGSALSPAVLGVALALIVTGLAVIALRRARADRT